MVHDCNERKKRFDPFISDIPTASRPFHTLFSLTENKNQRAFGYVFIFSTIAVIIGIAVILVPFTIDNILISTTSTQDSNSTSNGHQNGGM